jgi:DNA-binding PadR family transcriptional regulator
MSLASGPKHGHALITDIESFDGVRLGPGTLYGAIARLEGDALIEPLEPEGRRLPYRITESGAASLGQILDELKQVVSEGEARLAILRPVLRAVP